MIVLSFAVLTAVAGAERGAGHSSLVTLTIVLLATCLTTVAPLEVLLGLSILATVTKWTLRDNAVELL